MVLTQPRTEAVAMRIVCGLSSSATALNAVRFAAALASGPGVEVLCVHVDHAPSPWRRRDGRRRGDAQLDERFDALADTLELSAITATPRVTAGDPAQVLRETAASTRADLIVIGKSRRSRLSRGFMGSVQSDLIRDATCPVAVIPAGHGPEWGGRVLLAQDATSRSTRAALTAGQLAVAFSGSVKILYDPRSGSAPATGWSTYDAVRSSTETIGAVAGPAVDVRTRRVLGALLYELVAETRQTSTAFVVAERPVGHHWFDGHTRNFLRVIDSLDRPWILVPRGIGAPSTASRQGLVEISGWGREPMATDPRNLDH